MVCCPGVSPARLNGVTDLISRSSSWICAPWGVESTFSAPGMMAGAAGGGAFFFLVLLALLYFGVMETAGAVSTGSGVTCDGAVDCATAGLGLDGAGVAAGTGVAAGVD